ncbi:macrolide family glycosyltransferase [Bacillus cytotoxicus]|uniref:macrolide family glycosyltransferase n=1 Tax=Bacillus cereus group sp. BfR-BA-01492 TaxID=2920361 RepID=UPI001F5624F4|nr:macrolide family glycosyltransferase [Bacillus cereus group sp. BfR-BA-01492]EMA6343097.1 glycosyl transferase [Bacillus cytotoxicus]EMA6345307.1 glycosyl transferase [Bacillus cytotoxicus]
MSKVLVINFPAEGHINPTIGLVKELVNRGEEVIYYCEEEYRSKLQNTGVEFRNYKNYLKEIRLQNRMKDMFNPVQMIYRFLNATEKALPFLLEEMNCEKFDYIIYDQHFLLGRILAEILQLPTIASCTTFAISKEMFAELSARKSKVDTDSALYKECQKILDRISNRYRLQITSLEQLFYYESAMTFVFTSEYFQPHAEQFHSNVKFIGPSIIAREERVEFPFNKLIGKEVIYLSMGTELNQQIELYNTCFRALEEFDGVVVISVGKDTDMTKLTNIPSHFIVRPYVPQLEVLQYTNVFITHGGMNSVNEGLYYDTPLLVLPITNDQPLVAKRVEELNAGIVLDYQNITPAALQKAVSHLLNNKVYKEGSRTVGLSLRKAGGYQKAVDEIMKFKKEMLSRSF